MNEVDSLGRKPFYYVEIDFNFCQNTYGNLPCTATGIQGTECFNTFITCQAKPAFLKTIQTVTFTPAEIQKPLSIVGSPVINKQPKITPVILDPNNGVGQRGAISIQLLEFYDSDNYVDPYYMTRPSKPTGGFLSRLRRRNSYYIDSPIRYITGYIDNNGDIVEKTTRLYFMTAFDGIDKDGGYTIQGKDLLKITQDQDSGIPRQLDVLYDGNVNQNQTNIDLRTGDGQKIAGTLANALWIDQEIMLFDPANVTGDTINNVTRGALGTTGVAHNTISAVIFSRVWNDNVVDVVFKILTEHLGIDTKYIPYNNDPGNQDEWDIEKANWLVNANINNRINTPQLAHKLLQQLCNEFSISLWWDERAQKIKLSGTTINLANKTPLPINDKNNVLEKSFQLSTKIKNIFTQAWIYYDKLNQALGQDLGGYSQLEVFINTDAENENAYGKSIVKSVFSNWLDITNALIVPGIASRLIESNGQQVYQVTFDLDAADMQSIWTGDFILLTVPDVTDEFGQPYTQKVHILQVFEIEHGHKYRIKGISTIYSDLPTSGFFAFIAENSLIDYNSSTEAEKDANWFLSDGDNDFADGRPPYRLT